MNRKQRRNLDKKGFDGDKIAVMLDTYKILADAEDNWIKEGEKVKLNVKKITSRPDWQRLTERYRTFVMENANTVFTVKYEEKYGGTPSLVTFDEDNTWLFWVGDLIVIKDI